LRTVLGSIDQANAAQIEDIIERIIKHLATNEKSVQDSASRIKQLQRLARPDMKKDAQERTALNDTIEDAIAQARPLWKDQANQQGRHIMISKELAPAINIMGNAALLRSAFYNLLKNSIEAMPEGGTIAISSTPVENMARILISDTGTGMTEETKAKVFDQFYTTKDTNGMGLGMSSVLTIIKEHGGEIKIKESALGKGTTFEINLPTLTAKTAEVKAVSAGGPAFKAKILIVDDEEMLRDVGQSMLKLIGHQADSAASADEAMHMIRNKQYDLVITDIGMPRKNGWALAKEIKALNPAQKIAVLSGEGAAYSDEDKKDKGVDFIVSKPCGMKEFRELVQEAFPPSPADPVPPSPEKPAPATTDAPTPLPPREKKPS
ncbi:MAG: ATP-binding protein, partial [Candidatus Margulisiibacteriota bacterium]